MKYIHANKARLSLITLLDGLQIPTSVTAAILCAASQMHLVIEYKPFKPTFQQIALKFSSLIFRGSSQYMFRDKLWDF
jgi:hypothetical protein